MDVDAENFEQALELLGQHLPRAAFVALDLEMTGITGPPETRVSGGDAPQAQYTKGRAVVQRPYSIVQVGICLFEEISAGNFQCRPFNVYVFPRTFSEHCDGKEVRIDDHFMGMSASSMAFLAGNGLDFNRWVGKGVTYTNAANEEALLKAMPLDEQPNAAPAAPAAGSDNKRRDKPEPTKPQDIALVEETLKKVAEFAAGGGAEMKLPQTNSFLALVLRQRIGEQHPALVIEKRPNPTNPNSNWPDRWVLNLSEEGRRERDKATRERLLSHIGFRRMWNLLRVQRRPVVLHNGFFDLLFMCSAFEGTLPHSLDEFKGMMNSQFPVMFDTKLMAEAAELSGCLGKRTALPQLSEALSAKLQKQREGGNTADPAAAAGGAPNPDASMGTEGPEGEKKEEHEKLSFMLPEGFTGYADELSTHGEAGGPSQQQSAAFHTAGYDAYQTGRIFAYFRAKQGDMKTLEFNNRINLMFSAFELRLDQADRIMYNGIVRHVYDMDTAVLHFKGLNELLKPVLEDGKRKSAYRWCGDGRAMLLVIYGSEDVADGAAERAAVESCLDGLLRQQAEQGRLRFRSLDEHLKGLASAALHKDNLRDDGPPAAKRKRTS